jgi:ribosomal protein S18 acetylase RimI-like enzyme
MPPSVKLVTFDAATWRELGPRMVELERQEWGARAFSEREMRWQATNKHAVVATIWDGPKLIGFAIGGPAWTDGRATLLNVLIDPEYRGRRLVWPLIAEVERGLAAERIRELEIDARVDNGFADAVERHYGSRATVVEQDHPSPYGLQRTIRVRLAAATVPRTRGR